MHPHFKAGFFMRLLTAVDRDPLTADERCPLAGEEGDDFADLGGLVLFFSLTIIHSRGKVYI